MLSQICEDVSKLLVSYKHWHEKQISWHTWCKNNVGYFDTNKWLKSIGYYDVEKNKKWNYALELKNIKKYARLVDITKFIGQDGEKLSKAPQSWCYINKKNK